MAQRCGVWQIKPMTSLDQDPLSTKSNNSGFGGYSQMKIYKGCKNGRKFDILVWFGQVTPYMSSQLIGDPKNSDVQLELPLQIPHKLEKTSWLGLVLLEIGPNVLHQKRSQINKRHMYGDTKPNQTNISSFQLFLQPL